MSLLTNLNNPMQNLTFDTLLPAWNALRTSEVATMMEHIPMLTEPRALLMTRVAETPFELTVMFRGFDNALSDTERGIPQTKKFLIDWIKSFGGQAQIQRGDEDSLVVRIVKPSPNPMETPASPMQEAVRTGDLVHIAKVRSVDGY
jgi:hypothetical protein